MNKNRIAYILLLFFVLVAKSLVAQKTTEKEEQPYTTRILLIYDCSNSMNGKWQSDSKITISKRLLTSILDSLKDVPNLELALRVYGHQKEIKPFIDCNDTKLEVPFGQNNVLQITRKIKTLVPRGGTPIAASLEKAADDFPPCNRCRNVIILITDGIEECGGDACAASEYLQKKGIALKPFIIGIGKDFRESFNCVGRYFDASQETEFTKAFNVVISEAMNSTTAQVNLFDANNQPTETNVNMTFYDHEVGIVRYNYVHTMNARGIPDTITLDPLITYDIEVQSVPPVRLDSVVVFAGKHNIIAMDAPQGQLKLVMGGSRATMARSIPCIVRKHGCMETVNVQNLNFIEKYLVGTYDLEVLCMPRVKIDSVQINQSAITTVELPMSGIAVIQKSVDGVGSLYVEEHNRLRLVYNMNEKDKSETLNLQPGRYRVVLRSKYSNRASSTLEKSFNIEPGMTTAVYL